VIVRLLTAAPHPDLCTKGGTFSQYRKKGKWDAAARVADLSKADAASLNTAAELHHAACCSSWSALLQAAAGKVLSDLLTAIQPISETFKEYKRAAARLDFDDAAPLLDLSAHAAGAGLLAFSIDLGDDAADGASILLERGGVAVINGHLHVGRRRLTLAHEVGHYFFADEFSVDWRVAEPDGSNHWETRLDRFARALLLPAPGLKQAWAGQRQANDDLRTAAVRVASEFRVDMNTLARRLHELALVPRPEADRVRQVRTTKADIVELELLVQHELDPPDLARSYVESVLRLYRNETITSARATDLLLETWEESDLPELPKLPESAIWKFVS
jgi:Zn-dependent peptidase ImmA (M78 family)